MTAYDNLTTAMYFIMQFAMYFYFLYVGFLTYLKEYKKKTVLKYTR